MRNNGRDILINLISNTIFQISVAVVSGSGIVYTIINGINNAKFELSFMQLCILVISCILITVCMVALLVKMRGYKRSQSEKREFEDVDDYYFTDYEKHVTVYKNGNGIIIHRFTVVVNNVDMFRRIRRKLNIEDGNIHSKFPALEQMMRTDKPERFDKFGFWYYDKSGIISEVKEFYWQKNSEEEDKRAKNNAKEIRWIFKIDRHHVQKDVPYDIVYAISVPGIAGLVNGRFNRELVQEDFRDKSSSNMNIDHKIHRLKYVLSFEDGIELETEPGCSYVISGQDGVSESPIEGEKEIGLFYTKYIFRVNSPEFNSDVKVAWKYSKVGTV